MASRALLSEIASASLAPHLRRVLGTEVLTWQSKLPRAVSHPALTSASGGSPGSFVASSFLGPRLPQSAPLPLAAAWVASSTGTTVMAAATVVAPAPAGSIPTLSFSSLRHELPVHVPFSVRGVHTPTGSKKGVSDGIREAVTIAGPGEGSPATQANSSEDQASADVSKELQRTGGQYWGLPGQKLYREDGTEWPWRCFTPADSYRSNTKIDLDKHFTPNNFGDTFAKYLVKSLRIPTDLFFQRRYGCRAMMLETVAAVPGMVAGMLLHLKSLRLIEHSGGWIKALLEEAENERMHLMTFMEVAKPKWYERALIFSVQAVFFTCYTAAYAVSPRIAHRIVGYLEEEAVHSYTEFLKDIDAGKIENVPAPQIAIDYWRLPKDARLRDVVEVVRADEAHHRDVNHFAANVVQEGKKLKDNPAPMDYH